MQQIIIKPNQSLRDVAIANYGTLEAMGEIVAINEAVLKNDAKALVAIGVDYLNDSSFYLDVALEPGLVLEINEKSKLIDKNTIRELKTEQTKYENG